jgi:hypothetical protein
MKDMPEDWRPQETNTHQDGVVAHVVGATVLGYFRADEALHVLLDIGFVWTIYLDGEMALLPMSLAVAELNLGDEEKRALAEDVRALLDGGRESGNFKVVTPAPFDCLIEEVTFYVSDGGCRVVIQGEEADIAVVTSFATREMRVETERA